VKPLSHPFSGAHALRPAMGICPLPVFSLHRGDALRVRGGGGGQSGAPFFVFPPRVSPRHPHSDMRPCYALRERYTMQCCSYAATPASARTVWGCGTRIRWEPPQRPAPHSVCATRYAMPLPSKRACYLAETSSMGRHAMAWRTRLHHACMAPSSSSASSSSFKDDVIRTRLLVWRARRLISR
jgi:hypothetical protein